jgi:signal transduction histidine kinase
MSTTAVAAPGRDPGLLPGPSVQAIHVTKSIALAGCIALLWFVRWFISPSVPALAGSLGIVPALLASLLIVAWGDPPRWLVASAIAGDVLVVTACIYLGGGTQMISGPVAYVAVIGLAGVLLSERAAGATAAGVAICYALLVWLEYAEFLPHRAEYLRPPHLQTFAAVMVALMAVVAAAMVDYSLRHLRAFFRQAEREGADAVRQLSENLRAPLTAIAADAQRIEHRQPDADVVRRIQYGAVQAIDLVYNVLDAEKLEQRAAAPERETIDLAQLAGDVVDLYAPGGELKHLRLTLDAPEGPFVTGDRQLLRRALSNLVSNAVKYTPPGGAVDVAVRAEGGAVTLSVRDNGPGVPPDERRHLFEPAHRGVSGRPTGGTGLGLYVVRRAAEAHGGGIHCAADATGGSRFVLQLPHAAPAAHGATVPSERRARPDARPIFRALAIALILTLLLAATVAAWLVPAAPFRQMSLLVMMVLLPTAAAAFWPGDMPPLMAAASIGAQIVGLTMIIHASGGVEVVAAPMYYAVLIGIAGLAFSERAAFVTAAASTACYGGLVWAELTRVLPHQTVVADYLRPPDRQVTAAILVTGALWLAAWVVSYAVRQLRTAYARAEQLRTEAVNALSHDLKNPLNVIQGYAAMISDADEGERVDFAHRIRQAAQHALELVRNVLDAAAIDAQPLVAARVPVSLNDLVREVVGEHELAAARKDIRLHTLPAPDAARAFLDPQLIRRALGNLVSNAIKYTDAGGVVSVGVAADEKTVTISVRDSGRGLTATEQARLFEKYSRASSGHGIEGTGLGLYIVRSIAVAHGGTVRVTSAPGQGSIFTLELPGS